MVNQETDELKVRGFKDAASSAKGAKIDPATELPPPDEFVTGAETEKPAEAACQTEIDQLKGERDQLLDRLARLQAEFENARKRAEREKADFRDHATGSVVEQFLPVLDNFERTFAALQSGSSLESIMGGIQAVDRQLRAVLESYNVIRIPAQGLPFDPEIHEAVATDASAEHPENTVLQELEPGYKMAEKVIRPARVRVSTKP